MYILTREKNYTDEQIINDYLNLCGKLNKTATMRDVIRASKNGESCSYDTIKQRFGGLQDLQEICGFQPMYMHLNNSEKYEIDDIIVILQVIKLQYGRRLKSCEWRSLEGLPEGDFIFKTLNVHSTREMWDFIDNYEF